MAREIKLSRGLVALVDDEDFEWLNQWKWCYGNGYATRRQYIGDGRYTGFRMHRLIVGLATGEGHQVDHINGDRLDNRRSNLRICDVSNNKANCKPYANNKSGYKGVYKDRSGKYTAQIRVAGVINYLGTFADPKDASRAYMDAAIKMRGEFANAGDGCVILKGKNVPSP